MKSNLNIHKGARADAQRAWLEVLDDEDVEFVRRFIKASGSLKELAGIYGVSYPTVRLRLDRLIEKISVFEDYTIESEFERVLRTLHAEGKLDVATTKTLLRTHERELKNRGGGK